MCFEDIKYLNLIFEKENYIEKVKFLDGLKIKLIMNIFLINFGRKGKVVND